MPRAVENLVKRKHTGGRRRPYRCRRAYERDRYPVETTVGKSELVNVRVRGGNLKVKLKTAEYANVYDPSSNKAVKAKIARVLKNPANRDYERRGVLTKGAIIETELGQAKVTSRPAQHGVINAVLLK